MKIKTVVKLCSLNNENTFSAYNKKVLLVVQ